MEKLSGVFLLLLIVLIFPHSLYSALQGPAPPASLKLGRGLSGNMDIGLNLSSGNYKVKTFHFNLLTNFNVPQNLITFSANLNYGTISYDGKKYIENTNNYVLLLKHLLFFHSGGKSYIFYGLQDQSDKFRGYWNIFGIEGGMGYNILETSYLTMRSELGLDYSQTIYTISPKENVVSGMSYLHISWKVTDNFSTLFETKYLSNLRDVKLQDYKVDSLLSFLITVTSKIGLRTDLNLSYINKPPLIYPLTSEGEVIPGSKPVPGKRLSYSFIQSLMVKFQ